VGAENGDLAGIFADYEPWEDPPDPSKVAVGDATLSDNVFIDHEGYQCSYQTYDVTQSFDRVLGLSTAHASVMPGMLLEGHSVLQGVFNTLPVKRGPITISIDVPIDNPIREIESPNSATIQEAILSLISDAEDEGVSRSNFVHSTQVVESFEHASFYFGIDVDYAGPLASAGLDASFSSERTVFEHTFALKHIEELFTITFADDLILAESDFFADDVTTSDLESLEDRGLIGPGRPPVYVKSVTYGRLVLATANVQNQYDTTDFEVVVNANAFDTDVTTELEEEYESLANNVEWNLLVRGATRDEALAALENAAIEDMFGPADATAAVPLYFKLKFAAGARLDARTGDTTTYVEQACFPTGSEPCEYACASGWTKISETRCETSGQGATSWSFEANGSANARTSGSLYDLPQPAPASSARVCFSATRTGGGMFDDGNSAISVACGPAGSTTPSRIVTRAELWDGVNWCWNDVGADARCDATSPHEEWTPDLQSAGQATVSLTVEQYAGAPRCYADQW
jgi:hypothetical protein